MESNIKGLVAAGHEMASELKAECGAVDMRSVAKLISDLATQLEVHLVRANALAAENAGLKAGAMYFSYGSEFSFECHKTAEEAIAAAEAAIGDYRGDACDGWSEEVESICWGVIIQQATKVGERKKRKCDRVSPWIERVCDYELRPNVETPATDAFLDEVRAQAFNDLCSAFVKDAKVVGLDDGDIVTVKEATDALLHCADQLRKGVHS